MTRDCAACHYVQVTDVRGRDRQGCTRFGKGKDGKVITPPRGGFDTVFERMPARDMDWRVDHCGPEGRNWTKRED